AFKEQADGLKKNIFSNKDFINIDRIAFKNPLGTFHIKKIPNTLTPWKLIFPRELSAEKETIESIFEILKNVKTKKIYPQEPINMANFSLNNPLIEIELFYLDGKRNKLLLGLINPIDNSTYIVKANDGVIYHVDALKGPLETLDFTNFIDSKIIALDRNDINSIKIYNGPIKKRRVQLHMKKKKGNWYDKRGKILDQKKVTKYIESLLSLKSSFILDKMDDKARKKINAYLSNPLYSMEITDKNDNVITYKISSLVNSLPGIKIERRQNFIIEASHRNHPLLFNKKDLNYFTKR
ncbi:MAG: DUF4340 domain-containing protein, partial [Halobacteriovoraceae bacterium]|nr:DUF4340 domain-containing protein [Halobacteriovoraceae bacterium]